MLGKMNILKVGAIVLSLFAAAWHLAILCRRIWTLRLEIAGLDIEGSSVAILAARISSVGVLLLVARITYRVSIGQVKCPPASRASRRSNLAISALVLMAVVMIVLLAYPGFLGVYIAISEYIRSDEHLSLSIAQSVYGLLLLFASIGLFAIASWKDWIRTRNDSRALPP